MRPEGVVPPTNPNRADLNHTLPWVLGPSIELGLHVNLASNANWAHTVDFVHDACHCRLKAMLYARTSKVTSLDVDIIFTSKVNQNLGSWTIFMILDLEAPA